MQSAELSHIRDRPQQLVFSQTTAWKMGRFQDLAARGGFLTLQLSGPESLCYGNAQD